MDLLTILQTDFQPDLGQKSNGLLVKKWTSVIRMQKKASYPPLINWLRLLKVIVVEDSGSRSAIAGSFARQLEHGRSTTWF
jgi:hypothetical protein